MAVAFVKDAGSLAAKSGGTTLAATVPAGGHAVGNQMVIQIGWATGANITSMTVTDSRGNTYTSITTNTGKAAGIAIFVSTLATALQAGDTITVTIVGSTWTKVAMGGTEFTGLSLTGGTVAQSAAFGSTTTPVSGNFTPTAPNDLMVAAFFSDGPSSEGWNSDADSAGGASWGSSAGAGTTGGSAASNIYFHPCWKITVSAASQQFDPTITTAHTGQIIMLSIKAAVVTTPMSGTDTAVGADNASVNKAALTSADTDNGVDAQSLIAVAATSDTGSSVEAAAYTYALTAADAGVGSETAAFISPVAAADVGVGTDAQTETYQASSSDNATSTEAASYRYAFSVADSSVGTDSATVAVPVSAADAGVGSDSATLVFAISAPESAASSDAQTPKAVSTNGDVATGSDVASYRYALSTADSGAGVEGATASAGVVPIFASDAAVGNDALGAGSFSPSSITGLGIWLDASQLALADNAPVNPWSNLAPSGPATTIDGAIAPPTISTTKLNGQRVVRFRQGEGRLRTPSSGINYAFTVAYVARIVGPGVDRVMSSAYPPANVLFGWWGGYEDVAYTTSGGFFVPDVKKPWTNTWRMYSANADNPPNYYLRLYRDGVLLGTDGGTGGSAGTSDGFGDHFSLSGYTGDPADSGETSDCEIAEVVVYNRKLSDVERQQVEGYLFDKWMGAGVGQDPIKVAIVSADAAIGTDSTSVVQETITPKSSADAAVGSDIATIKVTYAMSDSGVGSEVAALKVVLSGVDTAISSETISNLKVVLSTGDLATGTDAGSITGAQTSLNSGDVGTGSEAISTQTKTFADAASGADAGALAYRTSTGDVGAGADSALLALVRIVADELGSSVEAATILAIIRDIDGGIGIDDGTARLRVAVLMEEIRTGRITILNGGFIDQGDRGKVIA